MAINKVIVNGETKLDLTADTVTVEDVKQGVTFHDATGALKTGVANVGGIDGYYIERVCTSDDASGEPIEVDVSTSGNYAFFYITSSLAVNSWHNQSHLESGTLCVISTQPISSVTWYIMSSSSSY